MKLGLPDIICPKCEYIGKPARKKRGSGKVELAGWLMFPLGVPYSLWRMLNKTPVCRHCGSEYLIDAQSAVGKKLLEKYHKDPLAEPAPAPVTPAERREKTTPVPAPDKPVVW